MDKLEDGRKVKWTGGKTARRTDGLMEGRKERKKEKNEIWKEMKEKVKINRIFPQPLLIKR